MICNLLNKNAHLHTMLNSFIITFKSLLKLTNTLMWSVYFNNSLSYNYLLPSLNKVKIKVKQKYKNKKLNKKNKLCKLKVFVSLTNFNETNFKTYYKSSLVKNMIKANYYWNTKVEGYNNYINNWYSNSTFKTEPSLYKKSLKRFLKELKINKKTINKSEFTTNTINTIDPIRLKSVLNTKFFKNFYKYRRWLSDSQVGIDYNLFNFNKLINNKVKQTSNLDIANLVFSYDRKKRKLRNTKRAFIRRKFFRVIKKSRSLFRFLLNIRSKGKNRIIKKVKSLNHKSFTSKLLSFETNLLSILLKTPFSNSLNDGIFLIKNNVVYVNGILSSHIDLNTSIGDRVQIVISKSSYLWLKSKKLILSKGFKKNLRLFYRKKFKTKGRFKKKSYSYPKWLIKYSMINNTSPKSIEFDLTTLTSILLYQPTHYNEFNSLLWRWININSHSLYLWKLIN